MATSPRFIWHDLMASDVEAAKRFYGELFGWKFKSEGKEQGYEHIFAGEQGIGGVLKNDPKFGAPPHWLAYVSVDDVDAAVAIAIKNGGKQYHKETIPEVGTFAVVADPTGAVFSPFHHTGKNAGKPEPDGPPGMYHFCWDELLTSDPEKAAKFYAQVFGWGVESMDMGAMGQYRLLKRPGTKDQKGNPRNAGGVMGLPPGVPHPFWVNYVGVPDCDATAKKAERLGGKVMMPGTDIPDVGRFAALLDPQMVPISILQPKM
jgi:predicted enzyme related to lactoylglutathione lyase